MRLSTNTYFQFVVDDKWVTDPTDPQETDESGNTNNVLRPEHIKKDVVTTDSGSADLPGAFPETPATEEQSFSVNPIAGTPGIGNPFSVLPGKPLPISTKSVNDNVTLDKASYDNAGSSTAPQLPDVVTPERERVSKGGMFGLDTTSGAGTMIPESGIAMGAGAAALAGSSPFISSIGSSSTTAKLAGQVPLESRGEPFISSIGPTSTTADLAGQVPLESSRVPEVVEKSQEAAHFSPEASANPEAVAEKSAVEKELQSKVPEAPATTGNTISGKAAGIAAGVTASATAAIAGAAAYVTSSKTGQDIKSTLPVSAQGKLDDLAKSSNGAASNGSASSGIPIASTVPDTVQKSISKAHQSPEAAANPEAVQEKSAVESELLKKVHSDGSTTAIAPAVPDTVQESIVKSHVAPEAAANPEAVEEKSAVESELLKKVHTEQSAGEPAPTITAANTESAPATTSGSAPNAITGPAQTTTTPVAKTESTSAAATQSAPVAATDSVLATNTSNVKAAVAGGLGLTAATGAAIAAIASQTTSSTTPTKSTTSADKGLAAPSSGLNTLATNTTPTNTVSSVSDSPAAPTSAVNTLGRDAAATKSATSAPDSLAVPTSALNTPGRDTTTRKPAPAASDSLAAPGSTDNTPGRDTIRRTIDSRDVSPMTRGPNDTAAPLITTGVAKAPIETKSLPAVTTPQKSTTPAVIPSSSTPAATSSSATASPSSAKTGESPSTDKKKNRRSGFFGRLKDKLEHRKDKN